MSLLADEIQDARVRHSVDGILRRHSEEKIPVPIILHCFIKKAPFFVKLNGIKDPRGNDGIVFSKQLGIEFHGKIAS